MKAATILVVDDEPQIRRVLRTTLTAEGYTIVEARDGAEAFEKVRSVKPDLVLLDMNMPGLDGLQVCREIRSQFGSSHHHAHGAKRGERQGASSGRWG